MVDRTPSGCHTWSHSSHTSRCGWRSSNTLAGEFDRDFSREEPTMVANLDTATVNIWCEYQRAATSIIFADSPYDDAYWWSVSPEERWEAMEQMRWMKYGQAACTG